MTITNFQQAHHAAPTPPCCDRCDAPMRLKAIIPTMFTQTVDDFGLPPDPQSTPPTVFCDGEDVELPALNQQLKQAGFPEIKV